MTLFASRTWDWLLDGREWRKWLQIRMSGFAFTIDPAQICPTKYRRSASAA